VQYNVTDMYELCWNIYIRLLSSVRNRCGSFCMNRATFRDLCVGGVLVKTCIYCAPSIYCFKRKNPKPSHFWIWFSV